MLKFLKKLRGIAKIISRMFKRPAKSRQTREILARESREMEPAPKEVTECKAGQEGVLLQHRATSGNVGSGEKEQGGVLS